ncbi:MAG: ATP-binding protein, partial [Polyangiales bacterium]
MADQVDAPETRLANTSRLLLTGEAGVGKSHLLADVAEHHIAHGFPAVLSLGGAFCDADPWRQIADQLGLVGMSPDAILGALDAAAEAAGTRALVMVDAINERNGISVWSERLAAFLAVAQRFDHVAVLISCRTTFVPYIVRDLDATALPRIKHPGFAGKAADAARRYLDQRGIVRMAAPHFAPELENPLFLRTLCDMLERTGERELPRGPAGVSSVFDFYFSVVADELNRRMGLASRLNRVEKALTALTEAMVQAGTGYLPIDAVTGIFESIHSSNGRAEQDLFTQLEHEGVLAVEPIQEGDSVVEMVRFTFERLSDHRIAQRLLDIHVADDNPAIAFGEGGPLAPYVVDEHAYRFAGIAEAFAVQLPERYGVELFDVVEREDDFWSLDHAFQQSLLWRRQDVFTERTLELIEKWAETTGRDALIETLLSVATEPDNRFNADYLDCWLKPLSMPERDQRWSMRVTSSVEEDGEAVNTLIEWVLANGLDQIEENRARLAAVTLAWLTSLSHRWVRDMATKALACLLVNRRKLAASLIEQFSGVDDAYVLDRVLTAAYGAATRSWRNEGLAELARAAFAAVFGRDPMPTHALVRDHARGIVELAAYRGVLPDDLQIDLARPPYPGGAPLETVSKDTLDA